MSDEEEPGPTRSVRTIRPRLPGSADAARVAPAPIPPPIPKYTVPPASVGNARKECVDAQGEHFGPYILLGEVGHGGMAEVRLAVEMLTTGGLRLCVVKRARSIAEWAGAAGVADGAEDPVLALRDEARLVERFDHPNLIALYGAGEIEGRFHVALEVVDGVSLRQLLTMIAPAAVPAAVAAEIAEGAARVLAYVHALPAAIVHRDVTPQNILVARGGAVKVVDFGIARYADRPQRTRQGYFKGKIGYLAPEQLEGRTLSDRTDVFALGLVITELLTGRPVLPRKVVKVAETESVIRARCAEVDPQVPPAMVELLVHMAAPDPRVRPAAAEIAARMAELVSATSDGLQLAEYIQTRALAKLLPLDLESIFDLPTQRVEKLGAARPDSFEGLEGYSATMAAITEARLPRSLLSR